MISSVFRGKYYAVTVLAGKNEIEAQVNKMFETGTKVGIDFETSAIHNMPSDMMINHLTGYIDEKMRLHLKDGIVPIDITKIFEKYHIRDGAVFDESEKCVKLKESGLKCIFLRSMQCLAMSRMKDIFRGI